MNSQCLSTLKRSRTFGLSFAIGLACLGNVARAATLATWTFETTAPATAGPFAPEIGTGAATGGHAGAAVFSSPVGNGSARSFSSNTWATGDYYQFQVSTIGQEDIVLSWDQTSSNTGPRDFALQYSTDGINFTNFGSNYSVLANASPNPVWTSGTNQPSFSFVNDLSAISAIENASSVFFRLTMASNVSANGGSIGTGGTDRVDNFSVAATPVPEPSTIVLAALGLTVLGARGIRRLRISRS